MAMPEMSAMTALTNIGANLSEIVGIAGGSSCVFWCWVPLCNKLRGYTKKLLLRGLAVALAGVAAPLIINAAASFNEILGLLISVIVTIPIVGAGCYLYFSPSRIATERKHPKEPWIFVLNFCVFIPLNFPLLLAWATWPTKNQPVTDQAKPAVPPPSK